MESIGRYQILSELGRGAGGVVYLAEDPKIGRKVAIKTISIHATGTAGETLRKRLQREARSGGSLTHPNIVTVYEMDEDGPLLFVVMEFVEGATLKSRMESGERLSPDEILRLLAQAADGLDFAHARSVVHRDVKPANIMVTAEGTVKIADFGVAKVLSDATMGLTQAGAAIGTPHYMSPEQVLGKPVEGRSDQFSLAVMAYELLGRKRPFDGDSITSIMYQIVNEEPPAFDGTQTTFSLPVWDVLTRALSKDASLRYESCTEFIRQLKRAVRGKVAVPAAIETIIPAAVPVASPPPEAPVLLAPPGFAVSPAATGAMVFLKRWQSLIVLVSILVILLVLLFVMRSKQHESPGVAKTNPVQAAPKPSPMAAEKTPVAVSKAAPPAPLADQASPANEPTAKTGAKGNFSWSGTLVSGDSFEIVGDEPSAGELSGRGLPKKMPVDVDVDPPDVHAAETPSSDNGYKLVLVNDGRDVSSITVYWKQASKRKVQEKEQ